jgi:hypothetical protein
MSRRAEHHVVPSPNGEWQILGDGHRVLGSFTTKEEAIDRGREISRAEGTELVIHNRDGRISGADSHGNDPERSPG